ncbi:S-layer homology domain-containing protein [Bacillus sp. AK128]
MRIKSISYKQLFYLSLAAILVIHTLFSISPIAAKANGIKTFPDVKSTDVFYDAVTSLASREIIKGYGDGTYRPNNSVNRAQAAKIIALALGLDTKNVKDPGFKDVDPTSEYYGPIAAIANKGIMNGYGDTFKPNNTLTRAQMSKIISLGFGLGETSLAHNPFIDVNKGDWFAIYLPALIENKITTGKTANTFDPNGKVTRGQLAAFVYRSENAVSTNVIESEIVNITSTSVELESGTYTLADEWKQWLSPTNLGALKGAKVKFHDENSVIKHVESIEMIASGSIDATNPIFDGKGASFSGDLIISGDYITVKNLTILGDLVIGVDVKNSFYADTVIVEGNTLLSDRVATISTIHSGTTISSSFAYNVLSESISHTTITFVNTKLKALEVKKEGAVIETLGTTSVQVFNVYANTGIKADSSIVIPKVVIQEGANEVTIDASVNELSVSTKESFLLKGKGNIQKATILSDTQINIETAGTIDKFETRSINSKITLGDLAKIVDLILPEGARAEEVVEDYELVKGNIEKVGGEASAPTIEVEPGSGIYIFKGADIKDGFVHIQQFPYTEEDGVFGSSINPTIDYSIKNGEIRMDFTNFGEVTFEKYYFTIENSGVLYIGEFTADEILNGTVKEMDVRGMHTVLEISHPYTNNEMEQEFISLLPVDRSGNSLFSILTYPNTKVPKGSYHVQYTAKGKNASYNFLERNKDLSINGLVDFTSNEIAKIQFNMSTSGYALEFVAAIHSNLYALGAMNEFAPTINTLYLTKGEYETIRRTYINQSGERKEYLGEQTTISQDSTISDSE